MLFKHSGSYIRYVLYSYLFSYFKKKTSRKNKYFIYLARSVRICIFSWYERYLVSFILFRHLLNIHAYGVSLVSNAIYSVLHRTLFLSLASSPSCFHRLTVTNCEIPRQNESTENVGEASGEVTG